MWSKISLYAPYDLYRVLLGKAPRAFFVCMCRSSQSFLNLPSTNKGEFYPACSYGHFTNYNSERGDQSVCSNQQIPRVKFYEILFTFTNRRLVVASRGQQTMEDATILQHQPCEERADLLLDALSLEGMKRRGWPSTDRLYMDLLNPVIQRIITPPLSHHSPAMKRLRRRTGCTCMVIIHAHL